MELNNTYIIVFLLILISSVYLYMVYGKKEKFDIPGPATIMKQAQEIPVPREVSPSGPNPPNSRISESEARKLDVLNVIPSDPYDETYGSQNMRDNLRYPERSFGPGVVNDIKKLYVDSGVASPRINSTNNQIQEYSQEMVENGGIFNDGYGANDTNLNPNYASF